jgi:hypothetical protein
MSNMARSDEIDELVSSVRSLVAQKDTGAVRKMPPQDRLILTPALRIDATQPETRENTANAEPRDILVLENAVAGDRPSLEGTVAGLEAAVTARAEDWEPDGGEAFHQATWAASAFQTTQDDSQSVTLPEAEKAEDAPATEAPAMDTAAIDLPSPDTDTPAEDDPSDLETRIASDLVMQHFGAQIDETALRDAVLRILREELSGDMGERITRNVRKLVRREINRVLVSRDLD